MSVTSAAAPAEITPRDVRRVVLSSFVGTALEWYDFFLYGTTASIVFAPLFFPQTADPIIPVLASFVLFGIGFLARPLGAVLFGHLGDRHGRRATLIATITIMGVVTTLMGLLPSYHTAGLVAPITLTLLRMVQGIATGGEWGGATLMALEYAPPERKGLYASVVQMGSPVGNLLSTGAVALIVPLAGSHFLSWGWRIPYLFSIVLVGISLWMRLRISETPAFRRLEAGQEVDRMPLLDLLRSSWREVLVATFAYLFGIAGFFTMTTYAIQYVTGVLKLDKTIVLNGMLIGAGTEIVALFVAGWWSRRIGSAAVVVWGYVITVLVSVPFFLLISTRSTVLIYLAYAVCFGLTGLPYGPIGAMMNKLFPTRTGYSGLAISANLASVLSGPMPTVVVWINTISNNSVWGPAGTMLVLALISLVASLIAQRMVSRREPAAR